MTFPHLFQPLEMAGSRLRNRVALPATLTNYGRENRVTDRWIQFLAARARGGTALIVSEVIAVDPGALAQSAIVTGFDNSNREGLTRAADAVHAGGATLVGQLWHPGRQQLWRPSHSPMGVSNQPDAYSWTVPHVMSESDLDRLVNRYVDTAVRLRSCGFDGVELHGAHGYLITQLLSPWSNLRTDAYGGDLPRRAHFCHEVAIGIRERCGDEFIMGLKMPADEGVPGGIDPEEAEALTRHMAAWQLFDYFAYGQGNFSLSLETHVPDMHYRDAHYVALHRRMRQAAGGTPVMALGRIGSPETAESILARGDADLIGMSRALISDAAWVRKVHDGQRSRIRPSVFNNWCWGEVHGGRPLAELHNPELATPNESEWQPIPTERRQRVTVVGAGPAGLEASWTLAARGHEVTLFGASQVAGGKLELEANLPGHREMGQIARFQRTLAADHGVKFELGTRASVDDIAHTRPDAVVLATGSHMRLPPWLRGTGPENPYFSGQAYAATLGTDAEPRGELAVLYDQDHTAPTYAMASALAASHRRVVLMTPRTALAQGVNYCSALGIYRRLYTQGVEIVTAVEPLSLADKILTYANVFSHHTTELRPVDTLVYATPREADDAIAHDWRQTAHGGPLHLIGDCMAPRNLMIAIHEGHALGNQI